MVNHWWQTDIIYQIYPRSYQDSNDDGIGDLPGIIRRLDYIQSLQVKTIWLSPIYPSPMHDFGYDVADYTAIHPMFGSMADFDRLLAEIHRRDMKLILDLVPNHTSDQHPWFIESRSSRDNPRRDWYIWRDPAPDGGPPNNWLSFFGGPAWSYDEKTGQYYLRQFNPQQPELNYRHPAVFEAMRDMMRFWLEKGVDGFRVDVIWLMMKDEQLRSEPLNPAYDAARHDPHERLLHIHSQDLPEIHPLIRRFRAVIDEYEDRVMIGEVVLPVEQLVSYYGQKNDECHLPFNFELIYTPWQAETIRQMVDRYESLLAPESWPNWVLGNHDQTRVATRVGAAQARVANMLLLTLRGTPTVYYGEEIGMENGHIPPEFIQDPPAVNQPEIAHLVGRDPQRTPMQWDDSAYAGFTGPDVTPWLPVADTYPVRNVARQEQEPASMLGLFRALMALRRAEPALSIGDYESVAVESADLLAYLRTAPGGDRFLIVLNLGQAAHTLDLSRLARQAEIALATDMIRSGPVDLAELVLRPDEGLILRLPTKQTGGADSGSGG